jgi:peptide/nickel transport system substrate-binding protein
MSDNSVGRPLTRRGFLFTAGGVAGVALGGSALLAACSTDSTGSAPAPGATGKPKRGGTLRVALLGGSSADTLHANNTVSNVDLARVSQLYDTLLTYGHDMKQIEFGLLTEAEPSADATTWTLKLREGVEFHNGKPLTPEDLVYTFEQILDPKSPLPPAARISAMDVANIKILDKNTLQVPFKVPYVQFRDVLADGGSAGIRVVPTGYDAGKPVGTGAFQFESFRPGTESVFTRFDNYWREGEPYLDQVVMTNVQDDTARVNALISGQVDALDFFPVAQAATLERQPKLALLNSPSGGWNPITMNMAMAPFNDVRVRQAFRLMVDRQQMVDQARNGYGEIANDIFSRYDPAYNSQLPQRAQDIDQAKSLLRAAGHENLTVEFVAKDQFQQPESFAAQAAAAGVTVKIRKVDSATYFSRYFKNTALSQLSWATRNYLPMVADILLPTSPYDATHWKHEKWLQLVREASKTVDDEKRNRLIAGAQEIEWQEGTNIIWGWNNTVGAYNKKVHGFVQDNSGIALGGWRLRELWLSE